MKGTNQMEYTKHKELLETRNKQMRELWADTTPNNATSFFDLERRCDELNIPMNAREYMPTSVSKLVFDKFMRGEFHKWKLN